MYIDGPMNTGPDRRNPSRLSWGPGAWIFLQSVAFVYPTDPSSSERKLYKTFFKSACAILPCDICRNSTCEYLKKHPIEPYLVNRQALVVWIYKIHNLVNIKLGKRSCRFVDFVRRYEKMRAKCGANKKGCTEAFREKNDDQVEVWATTALQRYWNYEDEENAWRYRQRLKWVTVAVAICVLAYLLYHRVHRRYKLVLRRISIQR